MIPTLRIQLLGHFLIRADDTPVTTVDSPRLQALLAYLVLHRDAPQPRPHLAFRLWPDTTEAQSPHQFAHAAAPAAPRAAGGRPLPAR